jgi:hypothetical protein
MLGTAFKGIRNTIYLAAHLGAVMVGDQYAKSRDPRPQRHSFWISPRVGTETWMPCICTIVIPKKISLP